MKIYALSQKSEDLDLLSHIGPGPLSSAAGLTSLTSEHGVLLTASAIAIHMCVLPALSALSEIVEWETTGRAHDCYQSKPGSAGLQFALHAALITVGKHFQLG